MQVNDNFGTLVQARRSYETKSPRDHHVVASLSGRYYVNNGPGSLFVGNLVLLVTGQKGTIRGFDGATAFVALEEGGRERVHLNDLAAVTIYDA